MNKGESLLNEISSYCKYVAFAEWSLIKLIRKMGLWKAESSLFFKFSTLNKIDM
jgi:hypothetical protein